MSSIISRLHNKPTLENTMEKEVFKEAKAEEATVQRKLKDLTRLEKDVRKAQKAAEVADSTVDKREQYEHKTAKAANNAIHEHDIAGVKLHAAERDAKLKHEHQVKLTKELVLKKEIVERAIQAKAEHDKTRETKFARMRGVPVSHEDPSQNTSTGLPCLPGQSGPAVLNNGDAPGYGLDYNRTAVDSEGNPQA